MKKFLVSLGAMLATTFLFTSCLDTGTTEQTYTFNYGPSDCFNRVYDSENDTYYIGLNPTYSFNFNTTTQVVSIDMSNVKLSSDLSGYSLRVPDLTFQISSSDAFYVASGTDLTPVGQATSFLLNTFNFRAYPTRSFGSNSLPVYNVNYKINGRYTVVTYPTSPVYFGSISATNFATSDSELDSSYEITNDSESWYQVVINPEKMTAKLNVYGAKYAENMVRSSFYVENLPVELTDGGYRIITDSNEEYTIKNTSNETVEGNTLSNIRVYATLETGATIAFHCDFGDSGEYNVVAELRYLLYNN